MIVSGLTTLIALAAVIGVIGYRVFHAGGSAAAPVDTIVTLPKGARVISSTVAGDRIVVTLDIGGATEIRTFDLKTLKETGRVQVRHRAMKPRRRETQRACTCAAIGSISERRLPSSSGPGRRPLTAKTGVRVP